MHVISLGYFCSVAEGIEKMGLRSASYPFDWVISDFPGVIRAINNHFKNLLEYDQLYQSRDHSGRYQNMEYGISFFMILARTSLCKSSYLMSKESIAEE